VRNHPAVVSEIQELAPNVLQITASLDDGFEFQPGQWVNFRFPEGVSRAYTIASAPERPQAIQLCVRLGPGRGSAALKNLQSGAEVAIDGPYGEFLLPANDNKPVVFLAGDTGIAPVRSIVLHMFAVHDDRAITVLYEPDRRYILYSADFDPLARSGAITHESGRIETLIERNRRSLTNATIMAVGFDQFLDRTRVTLRDLELDTTSLITESFGPQP
jgi:ferredoxin-NADP reductase